MSLGGVVLPSFRELLCALPLLRLRVGPFSKNHPLSVEHAGEKDGAILGALLSVTTPARRDAD